MKKKYTNDERKKIIDLIITIAAEIHESGVMVAEQLNMPTEIMRELQECSVNVDMINPCLCEECKPMEITLECKQCRRFRDNSCSGTDYFRNKEHYYCIIDWKAFKNNASNTRFMDV